MFNDFFLLNFEGKKEIIDCEYFCIDTFTYLPNKLNKYRKVFTRKDFNTREEYTEYLNEHEITNIENRYTTNTHIINKPIGTFLFEFLDMDFSKPAPIGKLALKYGPIALNSYTDSGNEYLDDLSQEDDLSIGQEKFEWLYKITSNDLLPEYRQVQQDLRTIIDFVYNLKNKQYLEDLTPSQRYFIFLQNCSKNLRMRVNDYINTVKISHEINYSELFNLNIKDIKAPEELARIIKKRDKKNHHYKISNYLYEFKNLSSAYYYCLLHFIENNIIIKECKNCNKYFIPENRNSTVYCTRIFENKKTCQDIGALNTYNEKLKKDEANALYRKTLSAKKMLANRNPDISLYLEKYEEWKKTANKYKQDIKNGLKTNEEFKNWIEKTR